MLLLPQCNQSFHEKVMHIICKHMDLYDNCLQKSATIFFSGEIRVKNYVFYGGKPIVSCFHVWAMGSCRVWHNLQRVIWQVVPAVIPIHSISAENKQHKKTPKTPISPCLQKHTHTQKCTEVCVIFGAFDSGLHEAEWNCCFRGKQENDYLLMLCLFLNHEPICRVILEHPRAKERGHYFISVQNHTLSSLLRSFHTKMFYSGYIIMATTYFVRNVFHNVQVYCSVM